MNEEKGQYLNQASVDVVYRTIDKLAEYASKYLADDKDTQASVHYMNIALMYAIADKMLPDDAFDIKKMLKDNAGYHLQKVGLEAKVDKYAAKKESGLKIPNLKKFKPQQRRYLGVPDNKTYDNPATAVPLPTEPGQKYTEEIEKALNDAGVRVAVDDIPF